MNEKRPCENKTEANFLCPLSPSLVLRALSLGLRRAILLVAISFYIGAK